MSDFLWNVQRRGRGESFFRPEVLKEIHNMLREGNCVVIGGDNGGGKTQTAVEFTEKYRAEYEHCMWVKGSSEDTFMLNLRKIADCELQLPGLTFASSNEEVLEAVFKYAASDSACIFVIDDVNDIDLARMMLPERFSGHAILTSSHPERLAELNMQMVLLEDFTTEEGSNHLFQRVHALLDPDHGEEEKKAAQQISNLLQGVPLALELAAAYVERERVCLSLVDLLRLLQETQATLGDITPLDPRQVAVETVLALSTKKIGLVYA